MKTFEEVFYNTPEGKSWDKWRIGGEKTLEVDMVFSVGGDCIAAAQQKNRGLRPYSLPFDWCYSDGEEALANFAKMFENDFADFALQENMRPIPNLRFAYKDLRSGYNFMHHFKSPIESGDEYLRFYEILQRRIRRFFSEIEASRTVLCLLSRTWKLKDTCLDPLRRVLEGKWPEKQFFFAIVTYNSTPPLIEWRDNVLFVRIPRNRTSYDMKERVFEWSFLDNVHFSQVASTRFSMMIPGV